jgi:hypothetical protein
MLGLQVRGASGGPVTPQESAIRELFVLLGAVPIIGSLLTLAAWIIIGVTINSSPENEGMHDRIAGGTRIVKARA